MPVLINFVLFQAGWFACLLLAARGWPVAASGSIALVVAVHLWRAPRPAPEARLVLCAMAVGLVVDSVVVSQGVIRYHVGQPFAALPPHWIVALWALFATTLNVSMRWLKNPAASTRSMFGGRRWLAALMGAVAAPLSYAAGVRLGAAEFIDTRHALLLLAAVWAVAMPLLVWLGERFDGVATPPAPHHPTAPVQPAA